MGPKDSVNAGLGKGANFSNCMRRDGKEINGGTLYRSFICFPSTQDIDAVGSIVTDTLGMLLVGKFGIQNDCLKLLNVPIRILYESMKLINKSCFR